MKWSAKRAHFYLHQFSSNQTEWHYIPVHCSTPSAHTLTPADSFWLQIDGSFLLNIHLFYIISFMWDCRVYCRCIDCLRSMLLWTYRVFILLINAIFLLCMFFCSFIGPWHRWCWVRLRRRFNHSNFRVLTVWDLANLDNSVLFQHIWPYPAKISNYF